MSLNQNRDLERIMSHETLSQLRRVCSEDAQGLLRKGSLSVSACNCPQGISAITFLDFKSAEMKYRPETSRCGPLSPSTGDDTKAPRPLAAGAGAEEWRWTANQRQEKHRELVQ